MAASSLSWSCGEYSVRGLANSMSFFPCNVVHNVTGCQWCQVFGDKDGARTGQIGPSLIESHRPLIASQVRTGVLEITSWYIRSFNTAGLTRAQMRSSVECPRLKLVVPGAPSKLGEEGDNSVMPCSRYRSRPVRWSYGKSSPAFPIIRVPKLDHPLCWRVSWLPNIYYYNSTGPRA